MGIIDTIKKRKTTDAVAEDVSVVDGVTPPKADQPRAEKRAPKKVKSEPTTLSAKGKAVAHGIAHKVLLSPVVSEKTTRQEEKNTYTFLVAMNTNKIEIKKAIKEVYGVIPSSVRIIITDGKTTRTGRRSDYKKAVITTNKNQKLSIHEGV
jgi:large subunit ribosomal protein L23